MAENDEVAAGPDDTVVVQPAPAPEPAPGGPRFTDRVWSFRALLAVALASMVIGAGIGSAVAALAGDDDRLRMTRFSDGPGERGRGPGDLGPPGQRFDKAEMKEFREEMKEKRRELRDDLRERRDAEPDSAEESPSPSPSPSASS